jgi:hypothetical protein
MSDERAEYQGRSIRIMVCELAPEKTELTATATSKTETDRTDESNGSSFRKQDDYAFVY